MSARRLAAYRMSRRMRYACRSGTGPGAGRKPGRAGARHGRASADQDDDPGRHQRHAAQPGPVMTNRPAVVAFDVIETLMSLEPLRARLVEIGQPPHLLEAWHTRT